MHFLQMWRCLHIVWTCAIALSFLVVSPGFADEESAAETIHICTPLELTHDEDLRTLITEAYGTLNIGVQWHVLPAGRCITLVNMGLLDADLARNPAISRDYENLITVPVRIMSIKLSLYSLEERDFEVPAPEILLAEPDLRIGYPSNSILVTRMVKNPQSIGVNGGEHLLRLLRKERVDLILMPNIEIRQLQSEHADLSDLVLIRRDYLNFDVFHVLNNRHRHLAEKIEKILRTRLAEKETAKSP